MTDPVDEFGEPHQRGVGAARTAAGAAAAPASAAGAASVVHAAAQAWPRWRLAGARQPLSPPVPDGGAAAATLGVLVAGWQALVMAC